MLISGFKPASNDTEIRTFAHAIDRSILQFLSYYPGKNLPMGDQSDIAQ
jgi:hypothetical protein